MGTEVLLPHDLLGERFPGHAPFFNRRRNFPANGHLTKLVVNKKPTNARRTLPRGDKKRFSDNDGAVKKPDPRRKEDSGRGIEQVTLLRRGESLDSLISKKKGGGNPNPKFKAQPADDLAVLGTARIGPDSPEMIPTKILMSPPAHPNVYAGSAFSLSPSPESLPLPSFFNKKQQNDDSIANSATDSATRDLRRLLRLD